jgi:eukaryotic-like serine/threonine-protein kinase
MSATAYQRVQFGEFVLDLKSGELWKDGTCVVLPNQPFRILAALIRRPGTLITRDDLRRELWCESTFGDFEHGLNAAVRRLRKAIGDLAAAPRFIETIPQRGYRFIATVEWNSAGPSSEGAQIAVPPPPAVVDRAGEGTDERGRLSIWKLAAAIVLVVLIGTLVAFTLRGFNPKSDARPDRSLVRLTSTGGLNTNPALSRDGTLLAYASDRSGRGDFDIYVQSVGGGDPIQLTDDPVDESEPSFSPDAAHIIFSRREAGLYEVGALGGEPRLIVRVPWARTPRFSPDGRWISYWTGFPPSVVAGGIPGALGSIFIVAADGGPPRAIRTHLASARYPIWSPDGGQILFLGEEDADQKTHDWYVIPRDGGSAIKTGAVQALRAAGLRAGFPIPGSWRARDNAVVFATNEGDRSNVWQIPISPSTSRVSGAAQRVTFGSAVERSPVVAESGRIAFASIVENVGIWRMPLDANTGVPTGALERVTNDAASNTVRSVSSDGRTLFFISSRAGQNEVWTRDLQTDRDRRLTYSGIEEASASPDASKVAFSRNEAGKRHIELISPADGDARSTMLCDQCYGPAGWSPDGERLLYAAGSPSRLLLYDFRSSRARELVRHPTWTLERPRFSPDGRWVAFHTANSPNVRQIYVVPAVLDGPVPQEAWTAVVTDHGCHPSWSSDGTLLYYFSFRDGEFCPWVQRLDPETKRPIGMPRPVMHLHNPRLRASSGAAAFNDVQAGYIYLTLTEATGNIWMIESKRQ